MRQDDADDDNPMGADMGFAGSFEPTFHDAISGPMLPQIGNCSYNKNQSYGRERRGATKKIISEIDSP